LPLKRLTYRGLRTLWSPRSGLAEHLYFEGVFDFEVGGMRVLMSNHNTPHETSLFWHGLGGHPERVSLRYWMTLCGTASAVMDVGANVGLYSLVAKAVNPRAVVWAFEPVERFFERLVANCRRNRFDIRCFRCALSDENGHASLWDLPADHHYHASLGSDAMKGHPGVIERRVTSRTLEALARDAGMEAVDLLKIDVEGWEPRVIKGMGRLLESTPTLLVEIKGSQQALQVEELIADRGYFFYDIDEIGPPRRRSRLAPSTKWNWLLCQAPVAERLGLET
jgi:FkbM family methyltransferase